MRAMLRAAIVGSLVCAAPLRADPHFRDSPHTAPIPADPCDTILTRSLLVGSTTLLQQMLNDPARRVFCVQPGDYRAAGSLVLSASGTREQPRVLRFNADDGVRNAVQRPKRATFEQIHVLGSHWVVQGLTIRPLRPETTYFLTVWGGDSNVIDGNLVDGSEQPNGNRSNVGIYVGAYEGDPAIGNTIQGNLVRYGNASFADVDFTGIEIADGRSAGESNDWNAVLDNEVVDWGDGISIRGHTDDCAQMVMQRGTIVDGNDVYVTTARRADCATGALDPEGECTCAENGIDVKANPGSDPALWTRITNNRVWGFRPTPAVGCGGSGSNGQAISAGSTCAGSVLAAGNVVSDATTGFSIAGERWVVVGNLVHEIRVSERTGNYSTHAIHPTPYATDVHIEFNTIVGVDMSYEHRSSYTLTECNVVIDDRVVAVGSTQRGVFHATERNFLYAAPQPTIQGSSNQRYDSPEQSGNVPYCYWRKRWSGPERVCIPFGATTASSTHFDAAEQCTPNALEPFGMAPRSFVPEPEGGALAAAAIATLAAWARRSRR